LNDVFFCLLNRLKLERVKVFQVETTADLYAYRRPSRSSYDQIRVGHINATIV
jgi:hypothetical protein